ncbi:MAG TPA: AMP-binding protein, partial [Polyangiaceae bacterium]|nr:AMP-binding protein [Polyangiaceae bacterium]
MLGTMMDVPLTLPLLLDRAAALFGSREIVSRRPDRSLVRSSYRELHERSYALARALVRAGLRPGERVATLMWNHGAHLEAYFGVPLAGGVVHTLNLRLPAEQIAWIVNDAEDRFLIVDEVLLPLLQKCSARTRLERIFVVPSGATSALEPGAGYEAYEDLLASGATAAALPELAEQDACGLCHTSGTTGHPKGVLYTHRSSVLHCFAVALPDSIGVSQRDVLLPVVPMFHV